MACVILISQPGMEPMPPVVHAQSLSTTREVPTIMFSYHLNPLGHGVQR